VIEEVTRSLAAALPGCTAEEIADVLWLLTARDTRWEAAPGMADSSERPDVSPVSPAEPTPHEAEGTEAMPEATQSELTFPPSGDSAPGGRMVPAIELGCGHQGPLPGRCLPYGRWRSSSESTPRALRRLMSRLAWRPPPTRAAWSL
jgi:hypothetical protein